MLNENCYGFAVKITCWWQIYHDFDRELIFSMVGKQVKRFGGELVKVGVNLCFSRETFFFKYGPLRNKHSP